MIHFHLLEVECRGSEKQHQVGEDVDNVITDSLMELSGIYGHKRTNGKINALMFLTLLSCSSMGALDNQPISTLHS